MSERDFDVIVLGGGPGGYVCAIRLGQLGLSVACVEEEEYGGVCLNWGCVPSKALISAAHLYTQASTAGEMGITLGAPAVDAVKLQAWKGGIVKKLTGGIRTLLKGNKATTVEGRGVLTARDTVEVTKKDGTREVLRARRGVVIATGSATIQVPGFAPDGQRILGAREAVELTRVPRHLLVIGGGVIGCELGMVYQALGAKLTVVELTAGLLPGIDEECVKVVERAIVKRGGTVYKSAKAKGWRATEAGVAVALEAAGAGADVPAEVECDTVLVSVGMRPRSRELGLEALGVVIDARGFVTTDDQCRTNVPGVYAIGDVSGAPMLAHKASKEGEVCAEVIAGHKAGKDWVTIPGIIFTHPEVATVGLTEAAAKAQGLTVKVGKFPFAALGRAMSLRETEGFVKVVTETTHGRVVGLHIVGPSASDLISEAALALELGATAEDLALTVHPHPTLGEALMEASAASLGKAIHVINR